MTARRVVRSYYTIAGLYTLAAALIWGVNTLFLLDAGLELFEVFLANTAFALGSVVFEIPTGVLADTRGRRTSFLASVAILLASTLGYLAAGQLGWGLAGFAAVSVAMGLGFLWHVRWRVERQSPPWPSAYVRHGGVEGNRALLRARSGDRPPGGCHHRLGVGVAAVRNSLNDSDIRFQLISRASSWILPNF